MKHPPHSLVSPPEGTHRFLKQFGTVYNIKEALALMELPVSPATVAKWKRENLIPQIYYSALLRLQGGIHVIESENDTLELYFKDKSVGVFYLAPEFKLKIRKRTHTP